MGMLISRYRDRHKVKEIADVVEEINEPEVDLESKTVNELKEIADEKNIEYDAKIKKPDLIKQLV